MTEILEGPFAIAYNVRDALWQEYELARVAVRACLQTFRSTDPHEVSRLRAARERRERADRLWWG